MARGEKHRKTYAEETRNHERNRRQKGEDENVIRREKSGNNSQQKTERGKRDIKELMLERQEK